MFIVAPPLPGSRHARRGRAFLGCLIAYSGEGAFSAPRLVCPDSLRYSGSEGAGLVYPLPTGPGRHLSPQPLPRPPSRQRLYAPSPDTVPPRLVQITAACYRAAYPVVIAGFLHPRERPLPGATSAAALFLCAQGAAGALATRLVVSTTLYAVSGAAESRFRGFLGAPAWSGKCKVVGRGWLPSHCCRPAPPAPHCYAGEGSPRCRHGVTEIDDNGVADDPASGAILLSLSAPPTYPHKGRQQELLPPRHRQVDRYSCHRQAQCRQHYRHHHQIRAVHRAPPTTQPTHAVRADTRRPSLRAPLFATRPTVLASRARQSHRPLRSQLGAAPMSSAGSATSAASSRSTSPAAAPSPRSSHAHLS